MSPRRGPLLGVLAAAIIGFLAVVPTSGPTLVASEPVRASQTGVIVPLRASDPGSTSTTTTSTTVPPTTTTTARPPEPPPPSAPVQPPESTPSPPNGGNCAGWGATIARLWPPDQASTACRVMLCESGGDTRAQNPSGASGLMQVMPSWADEYLAVTGLPFYDGRFDGAANLRFAAWLWSTGGWGHWVCR